MNRRILVLSTAAALAAALPAIARELTVTNGWSRETPPGVTVGVVYFTLRNGTARSDRLLRISSPVASKAQVHRTEILDGIARMREVAVLHVDAGQTVEFAPNGLHVMLMGLKKQLVAGQAFELELQFEASGPRRVRVTVRKN
jgi:copper(I)-binding protein